MAGAAEKLTAMYTLGKGEGNGDLFGMNAGQKTGY
jgi:hypothetical protein